MSLHAEAGDLAHIETLLNGHTGRVRVFDRQSGSLLFEGTAEDVRKALSTCNALRLEEVCVWPGET